MVYLPPDLVTKILSVECGIAVRAIIITFFEMPLLIRMRSPSRMVTRFSLRRRWFMAQNYHCPARQANYLLRWAKQVLAAIRRTKRAKIWPQLDIPWSLR